MRPVSLPSYSQWVQRWHSPRDPPGDERVGVRGAGCVLDEGSSGAHPHITAFTGRASSPVGSKARRVHVPRGLSACSDPHDNREHDQHYRATPIRDRWRCRSSGGPTCGQRQEPDGSQPEVARRRAGIDGERVVVEPDNRRNHERGGDRDERSCCFSMPVRVGVFRGLSVTHRAASVGGAQPAPEGRTASTHPGRRRVRGRPSNRACPPRPVKEARATVTLPPRRRRGAARDPCGVRSAITPSGHRKNLIAPARPSATPGRTGRVAISPHDARAGKDRCEMRDADLADHLGPRAAAPYTRQSRTPDEPQREPPMQASPRSPITTSADRWREQCQWADHERCERGPHVVLPAREIGAVGRERVAPPRGSPSPRDTARGGSQEGRGPDRSAMANMTSATTNGRAPNNAIGSTRRNARAPEPRCRDLFVSGCEWSIQLLLRWAAAVRRPARWGRVAHDSVRATAGAIESLRTCRTASTRTNSAQPIHLARSGTRHTSMVSCKPTNGLVGLVMNGGDGALDDKPRRLCGALRKPWQPCARHRGVQEGRHESCVLALVEQCRQIDLPVGDRFRQHRGAAAPRTDAKGDDVAPRGRSGRLNSATKRCGTRSGNDEDW